MDEPLDRWFIREIIAHEGALMRYLRRAWPHPAEIADLRQEVYVRIYESARGSRPTAPKSFLFSTARHLVIDRIRRGRVVSIEAAANPEELNVPVDELSPEHRLDARQELKRLASAFRRLPLRCREVVWLRKVDGMSQIQVAQRLNISVRTVEFQVQKGVRILADALYSEARDESTVRAGSLEKVADDGIE
jgi:RNA polymerase sigma factor (sigma-70 family)